VASLAAYQSAGYYDHQTFAVNLPGNLAVGTYYIGAIANYNNQINESNETNNTYDVRQITVAAQPRPDLAAYVDVASSTVAAGATLSDARNRKIDPAR
jgi:serralysin